MKLFNTLGDKKQTFKPLRTGKVSFYACGPTVYWSPHIGNMRTYIFEDILRRTLEYGGYSVKHIMNVTDVGHLVGDADTGLDKVEEAARKEKVSASQVTKKYFDEFKENLKALNVLMPEKFAWATKYVPQQKELVERLYAKKYAYVTSDGIYFDTQKFTKYGRLGGFNKRKAEEQKNRVGLDPEKKHPFDFALWKFSDGPRLQEWTSPLNIKRKGYPGWHIECSAISVAELGQPFDIHTGGIDNIAPHHNNEIAQSEAAYGKPLANYWLHGEHLLMKDAKMSKSLGNVTTLNALMDQGTDPLAFRYLVLTSHYRNRLTFSAEALQAATVALDKLRSLFEKREKGGKVSTKFKKQFEAALFDDLNVAEGLATTWAVFKSDMPVADKQATILDFDRVLGLNLDKWKPVVIPIAVNQLADRREDARKKKDWAEADKMRAAIEKAGFEIKDTAEGYKLSKKI